MGLILDTNILIRAERNNQNVREALLNLLSSHPEELAISSISLMEFAVGIERARTDMQRSSREEFLEEIRASLQVIPLDDDIAVRAGFLNGQLQSRGFTIGPLDLMIAATALEAGFAVATANIKHFQPIPDLRVVKV